MIAVGEHSLGACGVQVFGGEEADIAVGTDGHEGGGFNVAVGGVNDASAAEGAGDGFFNFKEFGSGHNIYYNMEELRLSGWVLGCGNGMAVFEVEVGFEALCEVTGEWEENSFESETGDEGEAGLGNEFDESEAADESGGFEDDSVEEVGEE